MCEQPYEKVQTSANLRKGAYNYILFYNFLSTYANGSKITATTIDLNLSGSADFQYQPAETPWVVSQYVNGTGTQELFKFYTSN